MFSSREESSLFIYIMLKRFHSIAAILLLTGCQSNPTAELVRELNPDGYKDATVAVLPRITSGLPAEAGRYHGDRLVDELVPDAIACSNVPLLIVYSKSRSSRTQAWSTPTRRINRTLRVLSQSSVR